MQDDTIPRLLRDLKRRRNPDGTWDGRLTSSALSTAVAAFALHRLDSDRHASLTTGGLRWLSENINADGSWGDTPYSPGNLAATLLSWAALSAGEGRDDFGQAETVARAEAWLAQRIGRLTPDAIAAALLKRYGGDRTFSAPILAMCALAGRLGPDPAAWRHVPQAPFELAAFPARFYRRLRLPMVSYALPALIAIGLLRHRRLRTRWPVLGRLRDRLTPGRLAMLGRLQPEHGGFLDAAPLTGFVAIALCGAGETAHPVACRAGAFLRQSVREDGSWPIDTHLKTWVTTQSVEALSELRESDVAHATPAGPTEMSPLKSVLGVESAVGIRDWLLRAQYARTHPYTGSPPGGWAWTDLPGGVPDADDTAGALIALRRLTDHADPEAPVVCAAAERGLRWLLDLQNSDGGMPTFCRGWGTLPFDRSCSDLTAHALIAIALWSDACSDHASRPGERGGGRFGARSPLVFSTLMKDCSPPRAAALSRRLNKAVRRAIRYLARVRNGDGSWSPLWFGNEAAPHAENRVYGTARSVAALQALRDAGVRSRLAETLLEGGARWLLAHRNDDGGWGAERGVASSVEETALALHALTKSGWAPARIQKEGVAWIENSGVLDGSVRPAPIGLYFARLWYGEALYSTIFALAACGAVAARTRHSINRFSPDLRPDSASTRSPSPENPLNSSIT